GRPDAVRVHRILAVEAAGNILSARVGETGDEAPRVPLGDQPVGAAVDDEDRDADAGELVVAERAPPRDLGSEAAAPAAENRGKMPPELRPEREVIEDAKVGRRPDEREPLDRRPPRRGADRMETPEREADRE